MDKEDIIAYAMKTPENVNPNMLRSMLSSLMESSGGNSLPDSTEASIGDVLSLDENKSPIWATPKSNDVIGKKAIFLTRTQSLARGATNSELYNALDDYNALNYEVFLKIGPQNSPIIMPLTINFSSGHPVSLKGTNMAYSRIINDTIEFEIIDVTITINQNAPDALPSLALTETTKSVATVSALN